MLKGILAILIALFSTLNAQSIFDMMQENTQKNETITTNPAQGATKEPQDTSSQKYITIDQIKNIAGTDEPDITTPTANVYQDVRPSAMLLSVARLPKKIYTGELYSMQFRANSQTNLSLDLNLTLDKTDSLKWLNPRVQWLKDGDGLYETTLYFQALDKDAYLKSVDLVVHRNGEFFQKAFIKPNMPELKILPKQPNFSHMVVDDLKVKKYKTTEFDDKTNITTVELEIKNGDLNSFHIANGAVKQGVDNIKGTFERQQGYYFIVLDKNITQLGFSYFNLISKKFENFNLSIKAEDDAVSTQIGLNPKESEFAVYKEMAIYCAVALLLLMFLFSKNMAPLIVALILCIFVLYTNKQYSSGVVAQNAVIRILPTKNSTVFYTTKKVEEVEIFDDENGYKKVLLNDGKIGWIKDEFVRKN